MKKSLKIPKVESESVYRRTHLGGGGWVLVLQQDSQIGNMSTLPDIDEPMP